MCVCVCVWCVCVCVCLCVCACVHVCVCICVCIEERSIHPHFSPRLCVLQMTEQPDGQEAVVAGGSREELNICTCTFMAHKN